MVYRLGKRVRRHNWGNRVGALCMLVVGMTATASAVAYPKTQDTPLIMNQDSQSQSVEGTQGSAHASAAGTKKPANSQSDVIAAAQLDQTAASCRNASPEHAGLANAQSDQLRKLAEYEKVCGGAVMSRLSFFVPTPTTASDAVASAADVATSLKEFTQYGVAPLVFMEPDDLNGDNLNLKNYSTGTYDSALDAYFAALKKDGITDSSMGMWVYLPEGNLPEWSTTDPSIFAADVTKTAQFQKKYFPGSKSSILLDSETYAPGTSWGSGSYVSLVPFVKSIPHGLIDSFGLQGFPWAPPAGQSGASYDPTVYLRVDLAAQAANTLGVKDVWLNTGTFSRSYANTKQQVSLSPAQRAAMLDGVISQAKILQRDGFNATIHLFAQDKSGLAEAINWSYWPAGKPGSGDTAVFEDFVHQAQTADIALWLFDTYGD